MFSTANAFPGSIDEHFISTSNEGALIELQACKPLMAGPFVRRLSPRLQPLSRSAIATAACGRYATHKTLSCHATAHRFMSINATQAPDADTGNDIGSGTMYNWRVRAVHDALRKRGKESGPLDIDDLCSLGHLDQYHYLGLGVRRRGWRSSTLAQALPCSMLAAVSVGRRATWRRRPAAALSGLSCRPSCADAATELTLACGIGERVQFVNGALISEDLRLPASPRAPHAPLKEWTTSSHSLSTCTSPIARHCTPVCTPSSLQAAPCHRGLCCTRHSTPRRTRCMIIKAPSVTSVATYVAELEGCGFVDIEATDLSVPWTAWCHTRSEEYNLTEAEAVALHGRETFEARRHFYAEVARLFAGGRVGGAPLRTQTRRREGNPRRGRQGAGAKGAQRARAHP